MSMPNLHRESRPCLRSRTGVGGVGYETLAEGALPIHPMPYQFSREPRALSLSVSKHAESSVDTILKNVLTNPNQTRINTSGSARCVANNFCVAHPKPLGPPSSPSSEARRYTVVIHFTSSEIHWYVLAVEILLVFAMLSLLLPKILRACRTT